MLRAHYSLLYAIAVAFLVGLIAQGRAVVPLKRLYLETLGPYISRMPENEDKRSAPLVDRKTVDTVTSSSNAYIERITTDTGNKIANQLKTGQQSSPSKDRSKK